MPDSVIDEETYLILLRYFDGDVKKLNKNKVKALNNGSFDDKEIPKVDKKILKKFAKIVKDKKENPEVYRKTRWIYPDWDDEEKKRRLLDKFPEEEDEEEVEEVEDVEDVYKTILPQRKAFIEWINNVFYKELLESYKNSKNDLEDIKIYQYFVMKYLSIENPFRGLLVYHGLGTGKTATSVITSEGLSKMRVYTLLPASLETEYIKEVKRWGDTFFKIHKNNWIFYSIKEIKDNPRLRENIKNEYGITDKIIQSIYTVTKNQLKRELAEESDFKKRLPEMVKLLDDSKGFFMPTLSVNDETKDIYTINGDPILKPGEKYKSKPLPIKKEMQKFIENQINTMIKLKYNFIHYNGFPRVHEKDFDEIINTDIIDDEQKGTMTSNQKMVQELYKKYQANLQTHGIRTPFKDEVVIIDEVHNFVREIMNDSAPAKVFYNWIIEAEDIKLIFLSGTPIINKPAEIAILYNMLRGKLHVFTFTIVSEKNEEEVQQELRDHFYTENSSIEQLYVTKRKGKLIVSFTKNKTNFESIMEGDVIKTIKFGDHSFDDFFEEVFAGLYKFFDRDFIIPRESDVRELKLQDIKDGKSRCFDEGLNIDFNRKHKLFDIYENDIQYDLSNNDNFVEYFLDDSFHIPPKKQVLLRRMLLGLTSYYPIDRSSIQNMPEIVKPKKVLDIYKDYSIVNKTNIVPCYMTSIQWTNYEAEYAKEKAKKLNQMRRRTLYGEDEKSTFSIRTRQNSNIVYEDDTFRIEKNDTMKEEIYQQMKENGSFSYDKNLQLYSPKFYQMLTNIQRFVNDEGDPTGKILYYSDFRHESGSEVFEKILIANGYEKFDSDENDIEELIESKSKKKRFTFLTGKESEEEKKINKESFNMRENIYGEYIQIMLISSSGAEGISLFGVRQVHIMEPFWNYIRIDQVFGRAIRMRSHIGNDKDKDGNPLPPLLPEKDRNVEQYLYLSFLPSGETFEEIFDDLRKNKWPEVNDIVINEDDDIKMKLLMNHKPVHKTITKILSMKKETHNRSIDQMLFDIMERKNQISSKIGDIIKESSVDCIQNTRDDIQLNEKCLRFSQKLKDEDSHFPGVSSNELNKIDTKQFQSNFLFHIRPNIYVVLAKGVDNIFVYYQLEGENEDPDIRYIRENGFRIADYEPKRRLFSIYENADHPLNEFLGNKLSVFKTMYKTPDHIYENQIKKLSFPKLEDIEVEDNRIGHIIKYNITERLFYSPLQKTNLMKLYDLQSYQLNNYSIEKVKPILLRNKKIYMAVN
uniref:Helicase C-terminal domain-containing protein n=1 Tax=viral metagenome TaxID=1070528 RepID=A0A6C0L3G5_9ZZZZ|tara:strand:+ start:1643 stop:5413 length:3771 start_codon:yes stop_codon:yes gene_type:complete